MGVGGVGGGLKKVNKRDLSKKVSGERGRSFKGYKGRWQDVCGAGKEN